MQMLQHAKPHRCGGLHGQRARCGAASLGRAPALGPQRWTSISAVAGPRVTTADTDNGPVAGTDVAEVTPIGPANVGAAEASLLVHSVDGSIIAVSTIPAETALPPHAADVSFNAAVSASNVMICEPGARTSPSADLPEPSASVQLTAEAASELASSLQQTADPEVGSSTPSPSPSPSPSRDGSVSDGSTSSMEEVSWQAQMPGREQFKNITAAVPDLDDTPAHPVKPQRLGIKVNAAIACVAVGLAVRFLVPMPAGVTGEAWTLLAIFCTTIAGLVLEPMPVSAWSMCCVTALLATKACTFQAAMSGLTNEAIWLIVFAFFFAKAFEKTGLGERVANMLVSAVGHSTLGLAYSLAIAETLVSPAMPSCTARAGGIFMPVIKSMAKAGGSEPRKGRRKMGSFLVHSQMQVSSNIAAMFMTGAAQNLLAMNIARSMGVVIPDVWMTWAMGALVPGVVSVIMVPALMYKITPPEVTSTPNAPAEARERLTQMGPLSSAETTTLITLAGAVVIWMLGEQLGVSAVQGAMIALSTLLVTGVLSWKDCLDYTPAWDTLIWFSVLMSMCSALSQCGLVGRMADAVGSALASAKLGWLASFGLLHAVFFWCHYIFASQVGHVGALYGAFLAMAMAAGAPATLSALTFGYSANLFGSLTHYASGPAAVYHGSGYTRLGEVMKAGVLMALRSWAVWGVIGMAWWKFLGWW